MIQHNDGFRILQVDRSSPAFWEHNKKNVFSMMRQLGMPHIFLTVSAAEMKWTELIIMLKKILDNEEINEKDCEELTWQDKIKLIQNDPITCARYYNYRIQELFKLLKSKNGIFNEYDLEDYYYRVEFQHRGSPHIHCMLWLKTGPHFNSQDPYSIHKCEKFIDNFMTAYKDPEISELINYQVHKHNSTCKKKDFGTDNNYCRFGFPQLPMNATKILLPNKNKNIKKDIKEFIQRKWCDIKNTIDLITKKDKKVQNITSTNEFLNYIQLTEKQYLNIIEFNIKRPTTFLKRNINELKINAYNKLILILMKCNMDIQFILDPYACIGYIINYIGKSQRGLSKIIKDTADEVRKGNHSLQQQLRSIVNVFINKTEILAQEIAYHILSIPLSVASRQCIYINTSPPNERCHLLKSKQKLEKILSENPNSTDIMESNITEHYVNRPDDVETWCLADYAAKCQYSKSKKKNIDNENENDDDNFNENGQQEKENKWLKLKNNNGFIHLRNVCKIIRYRNYNIIQDEHNFYREQLLLFTSWRNENDLINDDTSKMQTLYEDKIDEILNNRKKNIYSETIKTEMEDALQDIQNEVDDENDNISDKNDRAVDALAIYEIEQPATDIGLEIPENFNTVDIVQNIKLPRQISNDEYYALIR